MGTGMKKQAVELTRNQTLVLDVLTSAGTPLSAYDILDRLRDAGLRAPLQIYRALDALRKLQLVHRLESLNAFVACSHQRSHDSGLVAFTICDSCGHVTEFCDSPVNKHLHGWINRNGFTPRRTVLEIRGNCKSCTDRAGFGLAT